MMKVMDVPTGAWIPLAAGFIETAVRRVPGGLLYLTICYDEGRAVAAQSFVPLSGKPTDVAEMVL